MVLGVHTRLLRIATGALPLLAGGCGGSAGGGGLEALNGTPRPYSVAMVGTYPRVQTVGMAAQLSVRLQNIGAPIPHLAVVADGLRPFWTVSGARGCGRRGIELKPVQGSPTWDFGPFRRKESCTIDIATTAKYVTGAAQTIAVHAYGAVVGRTAGRKVPVSGGVELLAGIGR